VVSASNQTRKTQFYTIRRKKKINLYKLLFSNERFIFCYSVRFHKAYTSSACKEISDTTFGEWNNSPLMLSKSYFSRRLLFFLYVSRTIFILVSLACINFVPTNLHDNFQSLLSLSFEKVTFIISLSAASCIATSLSIIVGPAFSSIVSYFIPFQRFIHYVPYSNQTLSN